MVRFGKYGWFQLIKWGLFKLGVLPQFFSTEFVDFSKHEDPLNNAPDNLYSQHSMRKRWPVELIAALG